MHAPRASPSFPGGRPSDIAVGTLIYVFHARGFILSAAAAATLQQRLNLKKAARCILIAKRLGLVVRDVRCDIFFIFFLSNHWCLVTKLLVWKLIPSSRNPKTAPVIDDIMR